MIRLALRDQRVALSLAAIGIGVSVGYAVFGFLALVRVVQRLGFGYGSPHGFIHHLESLPWWQIIAVPTLGGLAVGAGVHLLMPGRRQRGIADVQEACALQGGRMDVRAGIVAALLAATSIGSGASVGREGPAVHIGATLSAWLADRLRLSRSLSLTLIGCGAAAAVAASFNAPIAGVFFALEVVVGHYALHVFAPVVIASVAATVVTRIVLGNFPAFFVPEHAVPSFLELPAFALLGVICAIMVIVFIRTTALVQQLLERSALPAWLRPGLGGLGVGVIGVYLPQVLGVGYEATDMALKQMLPIALMATLVAAKVIASAVALGSGFAGGVFSPALFIGAMTGGVFGFLSVSVYPEIGSALGAYTVMGMGGVAAAMLGAPISTILIVFELTADYQLTIAVMIVATTATLIVRRFGPAHSFFAWQLARRGVRLLPSTTQELVSATIEHLIDRNFVALPQAIRAEEVRLRLADSLPAVIVLVDDDGAVTATVGVAVALRLALDGQSAHAAIDCAAERAEAVLLRNSSLAHALGLLGASASDHLVVVDDEGHRRPIGVVARNNLLLAHNRILSGHSQET